MSASEYLFAVQDDTGREVCSVVLFLERVSDVTARKDPEYDTVEIHQLVSGDDKVSLGGVVATGRYEGDADDLVLLRWPADDKLSDPIRKAVSASE